MQLNQAVITGVVPARTGVTLLARLLGNAGTPVTQASLTSIGYTVTDTTNGLAVGTGTFTVSASVFNGLQVNDPRWTFDTALSPGRDGLTGYNFLATLPASLFAVTALTAAPAAPWQPVQPRTFQADVAFTPVSGERFTVVFRWQEVQVYG